jgi:hypothetical protein
MTELYAEFFALADTNEKPWANRPARRADVSYGLSAAVVHLSESVSLTLLNPTTCHFKPIISSVPIADIWRTSPDHPSPAP